MLKRHHEGVRIQPAFLPRLGEVGPAHTRGAESDHLALECGEYMREFAGSLDSRPSR